MDLTRVLEGRSCLEGVRPALAGLEDLVTRALQDGPAAEQLRGQLRQVRLALRHGVTAQDWDDCIGP